MLNEFFFILRLVVAVVIICLFYESHKFNQYRAFGFFMIQIMVDIILRTLMVTNLIKVYDLTFQLLLTTSVISEGIGAYYVLDAFTKFFRPSEASKKSRNQ